MDCGVCMERVTQSADCMWSLRCNHPVCWRCQVQLNTDSGCPYCRKPLADVSRCSARLGRRCRWFLIETYTFLEVMGEALLAAKFGHGYENARCSWFECGPFHRDWRYRVYNFLGIGLCRHICHHRHRWILRVLLLLSPDKSLCLDSKVVHLGKYVSAIGEIYNFVTLH